MSSSDLAGGIDEDLSLPKATVTKLVNEMLPDDISCAKETRDLLIDCCVEFIHLVSSEANEVCEKDSRKTIGPEHVITALQRLGFEDYIAEVRDSWDEHKESQKEREKRGKRMEKTGMTDEEMARAQEEMFAQARLRMQQSSQPNQ
ncbi:hypothetical protein AMAG_11068 [Allomyces macrogynus ATCC 38327]|uniref:Transcription factor CBF/NF-Y/archaeal histone domain-containing protein n=2 Tax=Allomyces macrogynus (strain ATCC 38327) TaxID=578462 RepID=A0A0L0SSG8_ALLM3|nr:negative cofactor 2 transcription regulator complex subunit ncb2 [Allomyces javanicus]KAJ3375367.1 negative cofactor 2 transcription regulator complex subunit ncb2 [Allomyces arbusculus]KNE65441.1 hypothetical protein AMAG_11068 [Allomyces macrogynus ATCC 38327]|eukprot:KNE65441.1 hypothetical protein AMAG_11068 [Allomyces macrogynus ATCC 38327]